MLILHGNNLLASRQVLVNEKEKAKEKGKELVSLASKGLSLTKLKQALESGSFFGSERLVVIEGLFSLNQSKEKELLLLYIKEGNFQTQLVIWEGKQIDGRILRSFSKAEIRLFQLSPTIFRFLDSFGQDHPKTLYFLHEALRKEPAELVFYLLARRVKELLIAKDLGKKGLKGLAPWQQARYLRQAESFSFEKLLDLHRELLKIDIQQKTGQATFSLSGSLDLLIASL